MTTWQKDVDSRRCIRAIVKDLMHQAIGLDELIEGYLSQALVYLRLAGSIAQIWFGPTPLLRSNRWSGCDARLSVVDFTAW